MNNRNRSFIDLAIKIARKTSHDGRCYFGGVLAKKKRVINIGWNRMKKTHSKSNNPFSTIHCEVDCLVGIHEDDLRNSSLYIARVGYNNRSKVMISRPCSYCRTLIERSGVRTVYYTINDNQIGVWNVKKDVEEKVEI